MKNIRFFALFILSAIAISCSEGENNTPSHTVDDTDYFNYKSNGVDVPVDAWTAIRTEDNFEVVGETADGGSIFFNFNAMGDLGRVTSTPPVESGLPWLNNFYEYASHYFDFEIVAIDEANKIIKVSYSGNLYEEQYDLTSASTAVEGVFNVHYTVVPPAIPGIGMSANIAGTEWHSVKSSTTITGFDDTTLDFNSDDMYKIAVNFSDNSLTEGTYTFTGSSSPKVYLSKYDSQTQTYIDYICSGTLTITDRSMVGVNPMLAGTFSFTAVNPVNESELTVTNGTFKQVYSN